MLPFEPAVHARELLRLAEPVRLRDVELVLAALVGEVRDPLPVRAPAGFALGGPARAREVHGRALLGRKRPDVAARLDHDALPGARDGAVLDVVGGVLALNAEPRAVARDRDADDLGALALEIEEPELRPELVDDLALAVVAGAYRRPTDVVVPVLGDLARRAVRGVVDPDVQEVIRPRVGDVVQLRPVPHRDRVHALPVCDTTGGVVLEVEEPDVGRGPAHVAFPARMVARERRVGQPVAVVGDVGVRAVGHRQLLREPALDRHGEERLRKRVRGHVPRREDEAVVPRPVVDPPDGRVVGYPEGNAARDGKRVDAPDAVVARHEGDLVAVRTEFRVALGAGRTRERSSLSPLARNEPEVVRVAEDDVGLRDVRITNHPCVRLDGPRRRHAEQKHRERDRREGSAPGRDREADLPSVHLFLLAAK